MTASRETGINVLSDKMKRDLSGPFFIFNEENP